MGKTRQPFSSPRRHWARVAAETIGWVWITLFAIALAQRLPVAIPAGLLAPVESGRSLGESIDLQ